MAKGCLIFVPIVAPRNKMEPHPLLMGQGQGGVVLPTVGQLLPPNHTNGLKTLFLSRAGHGRNVIGKGPTKGEQRGMALFLGFLQIVFELAVLVPRNERMDGIFPFDVQGNALFLEKGQVDMLIGDVQNTFRIEYVIIFVLFLWTNINQNVRRNPEL